MSGRMGTWAPWNDEQVAALNRWQQAETVHPFTCANRSGHPMDPEGDSGVLVATRDGWICRHCDYTQDWAHDFMFDLIPFDTFAEMFGGKAEDGR